MNTLTVRSKSKTSRRPQDSTARALLMVESASQEEISQYDETKIVDALRTEIGMSKTKAEEAASLVTRKIKAAMKEGNIKSIDTALIRSFVNVILHEQGHGKKLKSNSDIVIPSYDITQTIENANKENGNMEHNPESINFTLAENIIKDYVLKNVLPGELSRAHLEGHIHIHDLGAFDRAYCSGHSVEYVKKNGIRNVPNISSVSRPANSAWTLARHICSMTQFYSSLFAGAIGWEAINVFFAPLLRDFNKKKMKQLAQTLIFDLSQLAGAKGGQVSFTDFNVYTHIPDHYKNTLAMFENASYSGYDSYNKEVKEFRSQEDALAWEREGINGENNLYRYGAFERESQQFLLAILDVLEEGDANGMPFAFPKINMHIDAATFENKASDSLVKRAAEVSSTKGCPYFIFDRGAASISQCCRLKIDFTAEDMKLMATPEELRFVGVQNVSINLPNAALVAGKNEKRFYKEIEKRMNLAMKAHVVRTEYLEHLMAVDNSPLKFYNNGMDGKPYVNLRKGSYLIGVVGLNECVYNLTGEQMHDSDEAYYTGMQVITFMNMQLAKLSAEYGLTVKLEETPAESTSTRFATLDKKHYGPSAFVKENHIGTYYTNSVHFAYDADVDYIDRLIRQSRFHTLVDAGSMIHLWMGDHEPDSDAIYELIKKTWDETDCVQFVSSPEYTTCMECSRTRTGLFDTCTSCGSSHIVQTTRITGYFVRIDKFNEGKRAELLDRNRASYAL